MPFYLSSSFEKNFAKLDFTNSILVKIAIFLTQTNEFSEFDQNDQRIIKDEKNKKLVNDLMNLLLDESVESNKDLYEKTNQILQKISEDNKLKKDIVEFFKEKQNEISKTENRWDELKKIKRNDTEDGRKFKKTSGFFEVYKPESGFFTSGINIKLINSPITEKQKAKYKNNWENSKYFNLWLKKEGKLREVYTTKLADLLYSEGKKEDLFKIRSDYEIMPADFNGGKKNYIFTKYNKNTQVYENFQKELKDIIDKDYSEEKEKEYQKILDSVEPKSVLKTLLIIFFLDKYDNHIRNFIIKKNSNEKISLIPIDFGLFGLYNNIDNKKKI